MSGALSGKRVLFIAPRFFGYEREIERELRARGAEVDVLPDRPFDSPVMKAVTRFSRTSMIRTADAFYRCEIGRLARPSFDLVFVINGQTLSKAVLRELREAHPRARFVLYVWDSFENRSSILENIPFFDDCQSFDPQGCKLHGIKLRPLFFSRGFERVPDASFTYHFSFIGTAHTDRYSVVSKLKASLGAGYKSYVYFYLQAHWVYCFQRVFNRDFSGAKREYFHFEPLSRKEVQNVFFSSRAVVDIEHLRQTGLTIRTLETLGASRKLITTNAGIRDYDFYNAENICIIDRDKPVVPPGFLESPYRPIPQEVYARYSIAGWLDEVLGLANSTGAVDPSPQ